MLDFEVKKFTRLCARTERELKPGEVFYSYLTREGGDTLRKDVAAEQWKGPPEECMAWWKSAVPDPKSKKVHWAPHDVMLHYFAETEGKEDQLDVRYILALLMIRRRILRVEASETDDQGCEQMTLYCSRNETEYQVAVVPIAPERASAVQDLLSELLMDVGSP